MVNKAFSRSQHIYGLHGWWADNTGCQAYINDSFIWAHQADPSAKLILNDFKDETANSISNAMDSYIQAAKSRGILKGGIGMQMHIDGTNPPSKKSQLYSRCLWFNYNLNFFALIHVFVAFSNIRKRNGFGEDSRYI